MSGARSCRACGLALRDGASAAAPGPRTAPAPPGLPGGQPAAPSPHRRPGIHLPPGTGRRRWTQRQQKLALIYNEQGLRPAEIAHKLGVSTYTVTQIILSAKNRAKG